MRWIDDVKVTTALNWNDRSKVDTASTKSPELEVRNIKSVCSLNGYAKQDGEGIII